MEIAIHSGALTSAHMVRGVGAYTAMLIYALKKYESQNTYTLFLSKQNISKTADIVHFTYIDLFAYTLNVNKNIKTVLTIHDVIPLVFPKQFPAGIRGRIWLSLQKRTLQLVDAVITDSECSKNDIIHFLGIANEKISVIHLGRDESFTTITDTRILMNVQKKYSLPRQYLLYVGDVNWNKNVTGLVKIFSHLVKKYSHLHLVLAGHAFSNENLTETRQIMQTIQKLGIDNKVRRIGYVPIEDHVAIYNLASVYVQPSWYEGFGLPVLEAMSCGVPVVSSNKGSLPEVGGNAVLYADPDKPNTFVDQINLLLQLNQADRKRRIEAGIKWAKTFTLEKMARETMNVYNKVTTAL